MQNAHDYLEDVRTLVALLPQEPAVGNAAALALETHNQEVQDIACSEHDQGNRIAMFEGSRQRLLDVLASLIILHA